MPNCPVCNTELREFEGDFICKACKSVFTNADLTKARQPWYKKLCADDQLWYKKVFDEYPAIIAHEYWRLYDLLEHGQTYGALLQLKDVFEVLLKFPTLIFVSAIYAKQERTDAENDILIDLLKKQLALGDWEQLARRLAESCKKFDHISKEVTSILKNIVSIYKDYQIVHWRNDKIGHGALGFDIDDEFEEDLKGKIGLIKEHLEKCESAYCTLKFYLSANGEVLLLHGKDKVRNLNHVSADIFIESKDFTQALLPYILLKNQGLYFFDNYDVNKDRTAILNYPEGKKTESHRQEIPNNFVSALYRKLEISARYRERELEIIGETETSLEDETYSALAEETLNKISTIDDFQKPLHLEDWLDSIIKAHSKGVFLLQMERGMGKTTYARALDEQSLNKSRFGKDFSIRAYYIDSSYLYRVETFTDRVTSVLRQDHEGKIVIQPGSQHLPQLSGLAENLRQDFADVLNFYRRQHHRHFGKQRLLFIIDGLDEIPANEGVSIFEFIPYTDLLNDGVYLLLTCRTDQELTPFTQNHLKRLTFTANACFLKDAAQNLQVLTAYIKNKLKRTDPSEIKTLLSKAEHRFLYLKMLKELLAVCQDTDLRTFPEGKALFEAFLKNLEALYGEKFFGGVIRLFCILATAFEPLTIKEISYLYGEENLTFKLLAHLIDLRSFLNVERSYRGNLVSLEHEELKELIREQYAETICELIEEWVKNCVTLTKENVNLENDGEIYLLAYLINYIKQYLRYEDKRVFSEKFTFMIFVVGHELLYKISLSKYRIERAITLNTGAIELLQKYLTQGKLLNENYLAAALMDRGKAYNEVHKFQEAIIDHNHAIEIQQKLLYAGILFDEYDLALSFLHRGNTYYNNQLNFQEAIADYTQAIEIQQKLLKLGTLSHENDLATAFMNRGIVYDNLFEHQKAITDYTQAIEIQQKLLQTGTLISENDLAISLMNRAITYRKMNQFSKAIEGYTQAIEIQKKLLGIGALPDKNDLVFALRNIVPAYYNLGKSLALALRNRGPVYHKLGKLKEAIADYDQAIMIQQNLLEIGSLLDENSLAGSFMNRGVTYCDLFEFPEALVDLNQAIEIRKKLLKNGDLPDENDLAKVFINRGSVYSKLEKSKEAIDDYTQAITIQQKLLNTGRLHDPSDLVKVLMNRGYCYTQIEMITDSLNDAHQALSVIQSLLPDRPLLIGMYIQCMFLILTITRATQTKKEVANVIHNLHETLNQYDLTEEAQYWLEKIKEIL